MNNSDLRIQLELSFNMVIALQFACEIAAKAIDNENYKKMVAQADSTGKTLSAITELQAILPAILEELGTLVSAGFKEINKQNGGLAVVPQEYDA